MNRIYLLLFIGVSSIINAQRFELLSGSLKNLATIKEYNVVFDYAGMKVDNFDSEEAFINFKVENRIKHNDLGKAEKFPKAWYAGKKENWEPGFIDFFNRRYGKDGFKISENAQLPYTMTIKTLWIYPGYDAVAFKEPSKLTAVITVKETANPANVLVSIQFNEVPGAVQKDFEFNMAERIAASYEKLVKDFVIQLKRFL
jgi:hypothetical protein